MIDKKVKGFEVYTAIVVLLVYYLLYVTSISSFPIFVIPPEGIHIRVFYCDFLCVIS